MYMLQEGIDVLRDYAVSVGNPKTDMPQELVYQAIKLLNRFEDDDKRKEILASHSIAVAVDRQNKNVISCAAMRKPRETRKKEIFTAANSLELMDEFVFELGHMYTHENYRKQGILKYLVYRLLGNRNSRGQTVFATASQDYVINMLLNYFGFEVIEKYQSEKSEVALLGLM